MTTAKPAGFGPFLSTIGAAALGISVFLPWYGLTLTASGAASAQQGFDSAVQQFGNSSLQAEAGTIGASFGTLAGHRLATVSGHQLLKDVSAVLLILAGLAFVGALSRLAGASAPIQVGSGQIALVGLLATLCVVYRMVELPGAEQQYLSLSLAWGIWLALAGSVAILVGGLWPAPRGPAANVAAQVAAQAAASAPVAKPQPLPELDEYWRH